MPVFELYADPNEILDPREAAIKLATVLTDMSEETIYTRLTRKTRYAQLAWRYRKKYADVLRLGVAGIHGRRKLTAPIRMHCRRAPAWRREQDGQRDCRE